LDAAVTLIALLDAGITDDIDKAIAAGEAVLTGQKVCFDFVLE